MIKKIILGIIAVVILVVIIMIIKSILPTEKDRMRKDLDHFKNAVENKNKSEVLKYIDKTYLDRANMDYERFIALMDNWFGEFDEIKISISNLNINIDSINDQNVSFATCSLGLKVMARYQGDRTILFGGIVHPNPVRAFFKKSDEYYKVYLAEY